LNALVETPLKSKVKKWGYFLACPEKGRLLNGQGGMPAMTVFVFSVFIRLRRKMLAAGKGRNVTAKKSPPNPLPEQLKTPKGGGGVRPDVNRCGLPNFC
jgi:hypothetical protein